MLDGGDTQTLLDGKNKEFWTLCKNFLIYPGAPYEPPGETFTI